MEPGAQSRLILDLIIIGVKWIVGSVLRAGKQSTLYTQPLALFTAFFLIF